MVLALSPSSLGTDQGPFSADQSHFYDTIKVLLFSAAPDPCHSPDAVSILHSTALPSHPDPEPFLSLPFLALHSPRHTFVCKITCIAKEKTMFSCTSLQRHTIYREITCVAKGETLFSGTFMPRHTFFRKIPCIANENNHICCKQNHTQTRHSLQRHTIFREIPCVAKGEMLFS